LMVSVLEVGGHCWQQRPWMASFCPEQATIKRTRTIHLC
jgi:hypothetical protein